MRSTFETLNDKMNNTRTFFWNYYYFYFYAEAKGSKE